MSKKCGIRLTKCFFCGEPNGIAMPKTVSMDDDGYCPPVLVDYNPCKKCMEKFKTGVLLIEARDEPYAKNQPEIAPCSYPSGRYWVVNSEIFPYMKDGDTTLVTEEVAKKIGLYDIEGE